MARFSHGLREDVDDVYTRKVLEDINKLSDVLKSELTKDEKLADF